MDALRARFPHILVLAHEPEGVVPDERGYRAKVAGRDDLSVAAEFVQHVRNQPPSPEERHLFSEAFASARIEEASTEDASTKETSTQEAAG
jgi:exonuclease SbcD